MASILFRTIALSNPIVRVPPIVYARCCVHSLSSRPEQYVINNSDLAKLQVKTMFQRYTVAPKLADAVKILNDLRLLVNEKALGVDEILENPGFMKVCQDVGEQTNTISHLNLVHCLRNLLEMKVPDDSYVLQSVTTEVLWKARKMSIGNLAYLLSFLLDHQDVEAYKQLAKEAKSLLEHRWVEVTTLVEACSLLSLHRVLKPDFFIKLDDRMINLIEDAKPDELVKLLTTLAVAKRRATPVLRSLVHHLLLKEKKLTVKQLTDILYAVNVLSFPHYNLLQHIAHRLVPEIPLVQKPNVVASILTSVGQLKWKHIELLEACTHWIEKHVKECRVQDLVAYILTCGNLNYLQNDTDELFAQLKSDVTADSVGVPAVWLDVVWSLAVLKQATHQHIASVLTPSFTAHVKSAVQKVKLCNLNAWAKLALQNDKGLVLPPDFVNVVIPNNQDAQQLKEAVVGALNNFLPQGKFMILNKNVYGVIIDAEFIMGRNFRPLAMGDYVISFGSSIEVSRPLPAGAHRIAVMVWNYKDRIIKAGDASTFEPTGATALTKMILEKAGYLVIEIPHFEFPIQEPVLRRVQYLQHKIDTCIKNKTAD